jgi:hypothetical protein
MPEDIEVVLHEVGAILLDVDRPRSERDIFIGGVLLDDLVAGLCFDSGLLWIVDTAR